MKNRIALLLVGGLLVSSCAWAGALDRIRDKATITMGYVDGAAPFSFAEKGEPQGYSIDLCKEVAEGIRAQLGLKTLQQRWVALTLQNRLEAVRTGRVDMECSTTTWTLSRQKEVDFSLITFVDGATMLARADSDIMRFADYKGKRIAVIRGTTTVGVLRRALDQRAISAELVAVANRAEGMQLLRDGKVDGLASDRIALMALAKADTGGKPLALMDDDFSIEQYAITLPRGDPDFRLAVNQVLARLYRSGDILKIFERWLGMLGKPSALLYATYFLQALAE